MVAVVTGQPVSAQTVSYLTRVLDQASKASTIGSSETSGLSVSRWSLAEGATHVRAAARAAFSGVRSTAGRPTRVAGIHTGQKGAEETIERCFVEVRRRTRPMVLFTNVASVERIIYAIFSRFN